VVVRQVGKARKAANLCKEKHAAFASSNRLRQIIAAGAGQSQWHFHTAAVKLRNAADLCVKID
jgi:hypothetical protein